MLPTLTCSCSTHNPSQLEGNCHTKKATSESQNKIPPGLRAQKPPQLKQGTSAAPGASRGSSWTGCPHLLSGSQRLENTSTIIESKV